MVSIPPANQDGLPHFTYFVKFADTSFVWSGKFGEPIQVRPGGYQEQIQFLVPTAGLANLQQPNWPASEFLDWFMQVCDQWVLNRFLNP